MVVGEIVLRTQELGVVSSVIGIKGDRGEGVELGLSRFPPFLISNHVQVPLKLKA